MSTSVSSRTAAGAHDGADALGRAATATDHAAEVAGADADVEADPTAALGRLDLDGIGIVDDRRDDVGQDGRRRRGPGSLAGLAVDGVVNTLAHRASRSLAPVAVSDAARQTRSLTRASRSLAPVAVSDAARQTRSLTRRPWRPSWPS